MILQHGGDYQHYLKKSSVTHIIATNLTNAKLIEFKSYKIVKPEWIVESIKSQKLLPWQRYRLSLTSTNTAQRELPFVTTTEDITVNTGEALNQAMLANSRSRQSSTANPDFIKHYYQNSRLHYLSTWKDELKKIVDELRKKEPRKKIRNKDYDRVVMHVDFDCFFASVGIKDRPHLKNCPVAVSHSKEANENSFSDIASCNYVARSFGIRNGMTIGAAKKLCPDLKVIPYEFEKYKTISKTFYNIIFQYADEMQAVSVDEVLLEVGSHIISPGQKEALAIKIRKEINEAIGCEVSIGVGPNILLARLATKRAKPAGYFICKTTQDMEELLSNQYVTDLPGVGYSIREKLKDMNVTFINDVKKIPLHELQSKLGNKIGQTLYHFSRGIDDRPLITNQQRQSISAEVNWGIRFEDDENEKHFIKELSKEVSERLQKHQAKGRTITIKVLKRKQEASEAKKYLGHGSVDSFSKSKTLTEFISDSDIIFKHAYAMLKSFRFSYADIRGFGIHISKLDNRQEAARLAGQGGLNFDSTKESNKRQTLTNDLHKEDLDVEFNIDNELTSTLQQELTSNDNLNKQTTSDDMMVPPELPPWSQIDPSSLLALPDDIREQILRAYGDKQEECINQRPTSVVIKTELRQHHKRRKILQNETKSNNTTLTQLFLTTHNNDSSLPYDMNIWNALPDDIQTELLKEHTSKRKRQPTISNKNNSNYCHTTTTATATTTTGLLSSVTKEPELQGIHDLKELEMLLKNWVLQTNGLPPEPEDVSTLCCYLLELVDYGDLEKTRLLIVYLRYLLVNAKEEWQTYLNDIEESINKAVISIYGCPLKL
ncbi:uncharacterized protein BX663DRAFT_504194 [Cokeromyces recurvatus]|uniref:uncharacterized protein n=1 Tax=Cokeromyces recurvatus TaxID=90255 RepID=UPI00221F9693|nr:uncharacterized protein BX663DRAFT_504194 [Cokeromyces recurvatus]KAI7904179.1 hypothetical protein BX663DRAFT_504194 [Cokeromyces recurvatus]